MKLDTLLAGLDSAVVAGPRDVAIAGLALDSRQVRRGFLFAALQGARQDGETYVADAIQRGAVAILSAHELSRREVCTIRVPDARAAIAHLAVVFNGTPAARLRVVGITGTNGKTTTAYLVHALFASARLTPGLIGTIEYRVGARTIPAARTTPDAVQLQALLAQMVQAGCQSAVMEVSSHALDQQRVAGMDFDAAVFTNLTRDHLDYHQTMEQYFAAKARLFRTLGGGQKRATAILNRDDPWTAALRPLVAPAAAVVTYGLQPGADVCAEDLVLSDVGSTFRLVSPWGQAAVRSCLLGAHNVSNLLAAAAVAGVSGIGLDPIVAGLGHAPYVPGRLEGVPTQTGFAVFVDYAHTDDALANVLRTLRTVTRRRLLVVFGCGGDRDRSKRPAMGRVAEQLADVVVLTSDNPRREDPGQIIEGIRQGLEDPARVHVQAERRAAIAEALSLAAEGDVVLIAGKGHETYQEFANRVVPFDDRQVVRELLAERK